MRIRNFISSDFKHLQHICIETGPQYKKMSRKMANCLMYCDYYANECMDTSFALVNDDDIPLGYVMCDTDYANYEKVYRQKYLPLIGELSRSVAWSKRCDLRFQRKLGTKYHAHLHIDILPEAQRQGWGHKLIDALKERLKERNIPSVYLIVGRNNEKGNSFYTKYGFQLVKKYPFGNVFVLWTK